jgi:hypothetical protein
MGNHRCRHWQSDETRGKGGKTSMKKYSWSKELRRRVYAYQYWKKRLKLLKYADHHDEGLQATREIAELEDSEADLSETQIQEKIFGA